MGVVIVIICFCVGVIGTMLIDKLIGNIKRRRAYVAELERTVARQRRSLEFYRFQGEIKK